MILTTTMSDGSVVLGTLELAGRHLKIKGEARAERAEATLSSLLEGLVGAPVVTRQSIEEAMAEGADAPEAGALSPAEEREVRSQVFTNHYRGVLDEPLPVLDGMTPRATARTADSRDKVVAWLKSLENG